MRAFAASSFRSFAPAVTEHPFHFHVHRNVRVACELDDSLFSFSGDVVFGDFASAERFASKLSARDVCQVGAPTLFAMGLLHEIMHAMIAYARKNGARPIAAAHAELASGADSATYEKTLLTFATEFPAPQVFRGRVTPAAELDAVREEVPGRERALEEIVLLELNNRNPAYGPITKLLDDQTLRTSTAYVKACQRAEAHLRGVPMTDEEGDVARGSNLFDWLTAPMRHAPDSIFAQLEFARGHFAHVLREMGVERRLLFAMDVMREQAWLGRKSHGYGGRMEPMRFGRPQDEPERFTEDKDWMPRVVMIAKSTFVWLWQLEKTYGHPVKTLADVPDRELDELARRGFNSLWLIGLWRRSVASREIKQRMGKGDALASAYSLDDYEIAEDLGGYLAYCNLRDRAAARGIRLASDMVPNHMGIDSRWVREHPDRFLQRENAPYHNYTFNGPNLSHDGRVGLYLEDGYWNRSDAAVTFKRVDQHTGWTTYIYHGNDGTSMPWNDTAQLDYSKAHVREAVIQTILHVARMFPVIRFDAAMTLAKKHVQRLWFPPPGQGGAIPSRAESAMTEADFEAAIPEEFWREVVDRVAREAPDTLLLAEAFWLMEGYFVRTLGMHRVYNSAFMNMLKTEDNKGFRDLIKNVLTFDPRVLERFVNFMNNPDEEPAVAQFGSDDKYFGVCTLMSTLPGLPMFGHGQVEGFHEKYGMEFSRPEREETPNQWMIERHEREIFPLLRARALFSGVKEFALMDCEADGGGIDEDVIAYTNRVGNERTLVAYNNKYKTARGWLRRSASYRDLASGELRSRSLSEALGLPREGWLVMSDASTGLETLTPAWKLCDEGLRVELEAFKYRVLRKIDVVVEDTEHPFAALYTQLGERPVRSVRQEAELLRFAPLQRALSEVVTAAAGNSERDEAATRARIAAAVEEIGFNRRADHAGVAPATVAKTAAPATVAKSAAPATVAKTAAPATVAKSAAPAIVAENAAPATAAKSAGANGSSHGHGALPRVDAATPQPRDPAGASLGTSVSSAATAPADAAAADSSDSAADKDLLGSLLAPFESVLSELLFYAMADSTTHELAARFHLAALLARALTGSGLVAEDAALGKAELILVAAALRKEGVAVLAKDDEQRFLGVHEHEGVQWFAKERADEIAKLIAHERDDMRQLATAMTTLADEHGYKFAPWLSELTKSASAVAEK